MPLSNRFSPRSLSSSRRLSRIRDATTYAPKTSLPNPLKEGPGDAPQRLAQPAQADGSPKAVIHSAHNSMPKAARVPHLLPRGAFEPAFCVPLALTWNLHAFLD